MPRTNVGKTPLQRQKEAREKQEARVLSILRQGMAKQSLNIKQLSIVSVTPYNHLQRVFRGEVVLDLWTACKLADALAMGDNERAAICGGSKCKYD